MVAVAASLSVQKPCLLKQAAAKASRAPRAAVRVQAMKQEQKVRKCAVLTSGGREQTAPTSHPPPSS
jgi:hypothetical protein